ncbi:NADH dehydrogenase subunit 5 [Iris pallida]|uniref:NADH dehydrogenase subunit 5 (Mitochondrion) n=1 Tax=Iris pallida TaxID=29817 RepID=A0AAX6FRT9_IRIPA|nr:NADH dehydrogenase subunit 5 [Iris pallida]KAJ6816858.1 NADH dehydrogenase subunit 5 [Iris pallida]KAJ6819060.1 NADH dehydrogenase subunit 5 [Iris pallida]KAJ6819498.1 NADH dehydrogenase subunit 5 [Iris pallida]KAJ6828402.1 hypothetical protein M6B38_363390 [Iris pallida]
MIGTIEERKRMVAPFAQGTSSENNIGDRLVLPYLDIENDSDRDLDGSIDQ